MAITINTAKLVLAACLIVGSALPSAAQAALIREIRFFGNGLVTAADVGDQPGIWPAVGAPVTISGRWVLDTPVPDVGLVELEYLNNDVFEAFGNMRLANVMSPQVPSLNFDHQLAGGDAAFSIFSATIDNGEVTAFAARGGIFCYTGSVSWTKAGGGSFLAQDFCDDVFGLGETRSPRGVFTMAAGSPVTGVPEPASWALMIAGFGLVGAALRRRNASAPARYRADAS
ncbi:PEPxxWA-CTERM sorting domain-containing protein [Sandarakinorhabdus sp. DWP1-3-1]|uniref:PEPxxWA-CTERM sorting domain-containing protein n=1 Tax=Sandarakinorhabdus sp. DWP1-3-1 TaxID=2804627 RepID=UPI003CE7DB70